MSRANYSRPPLTPRAPRRIRGGLKPQRTVESLRADPAVGSLLRLVEHAAGNAVAVHDGAAYAADGQTVHCTAETGRIVADIQGTRKRPYQVTIDIPVWTEDEQAEAIDRLLANAAASASVFAGELGEAAVSALIEGGVQLAPEVTTTIATKCDCRHRGVCKHAIAATIIAADRALDRPSDLLTLRGLPPDMLAERMRQQRSLRARGVIAAHPDPLLDQTAPPTLEESIDSFWSSPAPANTEDEPDAIGHVSHALLRRLGPSPLPGRFPILGLLASVYDEVSEEVKRMIDAAENGAMHQNSHADSDESNDGNSA